MKKLLLGLTFLCLSAFAQTKTTIADQFPLGAASLPWYSALRISWPDYKNAQGTSVAAGSQMVTVGLDGTFSLQLTPTDTATPQFQYTVQYLLQNGTPGTTVQWSVPTNSKSLGLNLVQVGQSSGRTSLLLSQVRCASCKTGDIPSFNGSQFEPVNVSAFDAAGAAAMAQTNALIASVQKSANLSDIASPSTALANLGGVTVAQAASAAPVQQVAGRTGNITLSTSDVSGLGSAALHDITEFDGAGAATIAQSNAVATSVQKSANLSDVASPSTALANLGGVTTAQAASAAPVQKVAGRTGNITLSTADVSGLGSAATHLVTDFDTAGAATAAQSNAVASSVQKSANLSDVASPATALANLGGVTTAQAASAAPVQKVAGRTGNITLSTADVSGLGSAATHLVTDFDTAGAATAAQSNAVASSVQKSANLSDVANPATALANLGGVTVAQAASAAPVQQVAGRTGNITLTTADVSGLGSAATHPVTDFDTAGAATAAQSNAVASSVQKSANLSDVTSPATALANLGGVTAAQAASAAPVQKVAGVSPTSGNVALASTNLSDSTNLVRTNSVSTQALQGAFTAPQINRVFYVDGYPATGCTVSSTVYTTQYDCAKATASAWVKSNNQNALLVLGIGTYSACADIPLPNSASKTTLSMRGAGYWQTTIQQDCSITDPMSYLADPVSGASATQMEVTGIHFSAHGNAPSCGAWYGAYQSLYTHLSCTGWTGGQYAFQWGDNNAGGADGNLIVEDITTVGIGGASAMATSTATYSAGTITLTVTAGGSGYGGSTATVWILGAGNTASGGKWPCSTMPTNFTVPVVSGAVKTGTYTATASGCVSTLYSQVQNTPNTNYMLDFQSVYDSTVKDLTPVGVVNIASIRFKGGAIMSYHAHPYSGQIVGIVDYGGDVIDGYESDSPGGYGIDVEGSSTIIKGMARLWDNYGPYAGSSDIFINTAANASNIQLLSGQCYQNQTAGGYQPLVDSSGADLTLNNTYVNVDITNWQLCSPSTTQQNIWQGNARLYGSQFTFYGPNTTTNVQWQMQSQYAGSHTWQFGMTYGTSSKIYFTDATASTTPLQISSSGIQVGGGSTVGSINYYSTASVTPTSVAAQSCSDQSFAVSGLLVGDKLTQVSPPGALGNVSLIGYVTTSGSLTLHFCNASSGSVTPPAGVYSVGDFR